MENRIKKVAIAAVNRAGKLLLEQYKNFNRGAIKLKSHHEILTKADLLSEETIIKEINKNFPTHSILSEERGRMENSSNYLWVVDPLDGTTNFSMHNPLWSIALAVAKQEKIILGVVFAPFLGELYIAELGRGAKLNNKKIKVSNINDGKILNTFCHGGKDRDIKKALSYYRKQKLQGLDCRQLGSAAIELAYVAGGRIESIMIPGANIWDVAAGALLVREAGGRATDFTGQEWNLKSADILASNGKTHNEILRIIK